MFDGILVASIPQMLKVCFSRLPSYLGEAVTSHITHPYVSHRTEYPVLTSPAVTVVYSLRQRAVVVPLPSCLSL
jgi:hypothetical protein